MNDSQDNPPTLDHAELINALSQFAEHHKKVVRGRSTEIETIEVFGNLQSAQSACEDDEKVSTLWLIHNDNLTKSRPIKYVCRPDKNFN